MGHYDTVCPQCHIVTFSAATGEHYPCLCPAGIDVGGILRETVNSRMSDVARETINDTVKLLERGKAMSIEKLEERLKGIASRDIHRLVEADLTYGPSWRKRGGQQAFAVIWRKADRIENIMENMNNGFDIFQAWEENPGDIQDDIRDLRSYLLLLEEYMTRGEQQ
jgi:hypothetical protein